MRWNTEILASIDNIKDPFVKLIIRLLLIVVLIVVIYVAFALIIGKKIIFNNGTYEVVSVKTADSVSASKLVTAKQSNPVIKAVHAKVLIDTVSIKAPKFGRQTPLLNHKKPNASEGTNSQSFNSGGAPVATNELTAMDKRRIDNTINGYLGSKSKTALTIEIVYLSDSADGAQQVSDYLAMENIRVVSFKEISATDAITTFTFNYNSYYTRIDICIKGFSDGVRTFKIY